MSDLAPMVQWRLRQAITLKGWAQRIAASARVEAHAVTFHTNARFTDARGAAAAEKPVVACGPGDPPGCNQLYWIGMQCSSQKYRWLLEPMCCMLRGMFVFRRRGQHRPQGCSGNWAPGPLAPSARTLPLNQTASQNMLQARQALVAKAERRGRRG